MPDDDYPIAAKISEFEWEVDKILRRMFSGGHAHLEIEIVDGVCTKLHPLYKPDPKWVKGLQGAIVRKEKAA